MRYPQLPISSLPAWAKLNDVNFFDISVQELPQKGFGLASDRSLTSKDVYDVPTLLTVPKDLVLCAETVEEYAKVDKHFKELLGVAGGVSTRGDIMLFLLMQITILSPDHSVSVGVSNPWTEYARILPSKVPLPTTWTEHEQEFLIGTSLESALNAKMIALNREFGRLRDKTIGISWCQKAWWEKEFLELDDWILLDTWYRSRCLELPVAGESMVPCLDMANHSSNANAYYEQKSNGDVVLLLRPDMNIQPSDEITISYGAAKSVAEMLFSYGFADQESTSTALVLDLAPMHDDPLGKAKMAAFKGSQVVTLSEEKGVTTPKWSSPFIFLACLNEEDGLCFRMLQEIDGTQSQLRTFWQDKDVTDSTDRFEEIISSHPMKDIFTLRAVALIEDRIDEQISRLRTSQQLLDLDSIDESGPLLGALLLRASEARLLMGASETLAAQKMELIESPAVIKYLASMEAGDNLSNDVASEGEPTNDEDFS